MSFTIILLIMLLAGVAGGVINYLLPTNTGEDKVRIRSILSCMALGIGATILVPLFLEIAQSKLMDNIKFGSTIRQEQCDCVKPETKILQKTDSIADTLNKKAGDTAATKKASDALKNIKLTQQEECCVPYKNYFLYAAYCFLAAAAGFRFINGLIDSVLKDKQLANAQKEKEKAVEEKEGIEKENEKRVMNSQISQRQEDAKIRTAFVQDNISGLHENLTADNRQQLVVPILPVLPPVLHKDDPQKGRFGGSSEKNGRRLSATVTASGIPNFYGVVLTVESTVADHALDKDVVFYIHDSFSPSVFTYKPSEFKEGKAVEDEILSYGAFTVGVITDDGNTLLELDLSEDSSFPKEFRER